MSSKFRACVFVISLLSCSVAYSVEYSGDRISLNFTEVETTKVLAIIAKFAGKGLFLPDPDLGTTSIYVNKIPWDEALMGIADAENLLIKLTENSIIVSRKKRE